jgi:hypothetical protein
MPGRSPDPLAQLPNENKRLRHQLAQAPGDQRHRGPAPGHPETRPRFDNNPVLPAEADKAVIATSQTPFTTQPCSSER